MSINYEKLKKEKRLIVLPVPIGTIVYRVVPPCSLASNLCAYNGGYGVRRCIDGKRCGAYIEEEAYSLDMYGDKSIYFKMEGAEKAVERFKKGASK